MLLAPIRGRRACHGTSVAGPGWTAVRPWCRETPDDVLVRRARRGCLSAYAELTDRHGPLAYRVALRLLGDREDAADLTREACLAAWQDLSAFRGTSSYAAWLLQILIPRALRRTSPPAGAADAAAVVVAALPPAQQVAIVLYYFEGLPHDQVALITASTVPEVRRHLLEARRAVIRAARDPASRGTMLFAS
jgi:RNA polymerase sigma-70 factor, ECF subfamily